MQLPLELLEVIIKQLAGSRSTVRACTLVCSAWSSAALHVLFHDFTLQVAGSGGIHAGLAFPHYVSCLVIRGSYGYDQSIHLRDVLRLFDHATTIRVSFVRSAQLAPLLPRTFPHLRHLDLFVVSFPDPRSLHALVATFPGLERLSLSDIETEGIERINDHPGDLPSPPCFRTLVYINSNQRRVPFLRQLSAWHPPTLQHLTLLNILSDELESIGALLHSLGPHLHSLDISFKGAPTPSMWIHDPRRTLTHPFPAQVAYLHFSSRVRLHTLQISLGHMHHNLGLKIPLALLEADAPRSAASY
ncbi:hypothetical protein BD779DRAFT_66670 [Infundibulicybe gibba]|nr:hypothetical protein BD779DRAFT_66670 [Infundibulicybe gibba]